MKVPHIPREDLEGARKLQSVRQVAGDSMPLVTALVTWKELDTEHKQSVEQLWQLMQPEPKWPGLKYKFLAPN